MSAETPLLRPLDIRWIDRDGRRSLLLRDPLGLAEAGLLVPEIVAPVLALLDGTRDLDALRAAAEVRLGLPLSQAQVRAMVERLDAAYLLDNARSRGAQAAQLDAYRSARERSPRHAGLAYPEAPGALRDFLGRFDGHVVSVPPAVAGLICPHIDFERGGTVYAPAWQAAASRLVEARRVVILGTDHMGGGPLALTRQTYATPLGTTPTDVAFVDLLAEAAGGDGAFEFELHHAGEHSIELALVWLHHVAPTVRALVPVLCGSEPDAALDVTYAGVIEVLATAVRSGDTVIVAAGDLAHVGPAFGDPPLDRLALVRLEADDRVALERLAAGDAEGFVGAARDGRDARYCGLAPIYLAMRATGARASDIRYAQCPADGAGTSVVSVASALLRQVD